MTEDWRLATGPRDKRWRKCEGGRTRAEFLMVLCDRGLTLCFDVNSALLWIRTYAVASSRRLAAKNVLSTVFDDPILHYSQFKGK